MSALRTCVARSQCNRSLYGLRPGSVPKLVQPQVFINNQSITRGTRYESTASKAHDHFNAFRAATAERATKFKSLHVPGDPIVLSNIYDAASANIISQLPTTKALATASWAIAATQGKADNDLHPDDIFRAVRNIVKADLRGLPLSLDLQDGYESPETTISNAIELGASGCNIEDEARGRGLYSIDEAGARVRLVVKTADQLTVPDFVVNARTDVLVHGGTIEEAIRRGKVYLENGATTVFVWGGPARGMSRGEVQQLVEGLDGKVAVKMNLSPGSLTVSELKALGVARISVGPELYKVAMNALTEAAKKMMEG